MEKKTYKKPLISEVIDLDGELCEIKGESQIDPGDGKIITIGDESDFDDLDDWTFSKKSTIWDDEEEEY